MNDINCHDCKYNSAHRCHNVGKYEVYRSDDVVYRIDSRITHIYLSNTLGNTPLLALDGWPQLTEDQIDKFVLLK
jgi:hypothetical protein